MNVSRLAAVMLFKLILLAGCGGLRSYNTRAIYDAVANGYRIDIATAGSLPFGEDLNPRQIGTVTITPLTAGANPTIELDFPGGPSVMYVVGTTAPATASWDDGTTEATLDSILAKAGYKLGPTAEVQESAEVICGALLGPKCTFMSGQTKTLRVIGVTF